MAYVLYHIAEKGRPSVQRRYATEKGAKIGLAAANRNAGKVAYAIEEETFFDLKYPRGTKTVKNLMTGVSVVIAEDTPLCCDPSSETYWSM